MTVERDPIHLWHADEDEGRDTGAVGERPTALERVVGLYHGQHDDECNCEACNAYDEVMDEVEGSGGAVGEREELDVERLAQAMRFVGRTIPGTGFGVYADEVADEYSRLETEYARLSVNEGSAPVARAEADHE